MEELHLSDPTVLIAMLAIVWAALQTTLVYVGKQAMRRLDKINGSVTDHEKRMIRQEILHEEHEKSTTRLAEIVEKLTHQVEEINIRCIANRHHVPVNENYD